MLPLRKNYIIRNSRNQVFNFNFRKIIEHILNWYMKEIFVSETYSYYLLIRGKMGRFMKMIGVFL